MVVNGSFHISFFETNHNFTSNKVFSLFASYQNLKLASWYFLSLQPTTILLVTGYFLLMQPTKILFVNCNRVASLLATNNNFIINKILEEQYRLFWTQCHNYNDSNFICKNISRNSILSYLCLQIGLMRNGTLLAEDKPQKLIDAYRINVSKYNLR